MLVDRRVPALDGVRALAVLAVLAAHTGIPGSQGGFVGVDVFFVLSGFLITSLLLDEQARTSRVDILAFWARRARRLLPAALAMIAAVVAARPLLSPDQVSGLRGDAISAALWSSNWRLALHGTDYFAQGGAASPLQHTWSLAVEEQFYVIWPGLLLLVCRGARHDTQRRRRLLVLTTAAAAISASLTAFESGHASPGRVYFGTDTRAQELLLGAALAALLLPHWQRQDARRAGCSKPAVRRPLPLVSCMAGLAVLATAVHRADGSPAEFRHGFMLLVALASAALVAGLVVDRRHAVSRLLSSRPLVALGRLSYGVYLWHWPVFEMLDGARTGLTPYPLAGVRLLLSIGLAVASLLLVELPAQRARVRPRRILPAAAGGIAAVLAFTACTAPADRQPSAPSSALDSPPGTPAGAAHATSRAASTKPSRSRSSPRGSAPPSHRTGPLVVDVFGDSIGWTLVRYLPPSPGIRVVDHTILGCGIVDGGPYRYFGQQYGERSACDNLPARWTAQVRADRPDEALVIVGRWETMDRRYGGRWTHVGEPAFDAHLTALLRAAVTGLGSTGARVILATEPYNRRGEQPDGQLYPEDHTGRVESWNRLLTAVAGSRAGTDVLDLNHKLSPGGFTWQIGGVQVRSDGVHLTPQGVQWLRPWLVRQLRADRP